MLNFNLFFNKNYLEFKYSKYTKRIIKLLSFTVSIFIFGIVK